MSSKKLILLCVCALALFVTPVSAELILNGSFEEGLDLTGIGHSMVNPGTAELPNWSGTANFQWYINGDGTQWGPLAQDGIREMNLCYATGTESLSQSFAVTAGTSYNVSYYVQKRGNGGIMDTTLSVDAGTVAGADGFVTAITQPTTSSILQTSQSQANLDPVWTQHGFTFTPDTNTTATLSFENGYTDGVRGDNDGVFLDNVSVTGVPEPGTMVLLATGLLGLLAYAWRKRR